MNRSLAVTLNALGLYAVALVLAAAFAAQLWLNELPCPLCLLQRIQFAMLAVGPMLNISFGLRPSHYAVSLLTAGAGAAIAVWLVIALTALNVISTLLECGLAACPDNPIVYELLKRGK